MNYKYSLDTSSKKFICPKCGKKRFVRYVDTEFKQYLEGNYGRCDRESKCAYHLTPKGNEPLSVNTSQVVTQLPPSCHHDDVIRYFSNNYNQNNFVSYLLKYFAPIDVIHAIKMYFVCTTNHWHGATIFWQVDEYQNICAGKVMLYDKITGKRVKKPYPHINWIHKIYKMEDYVLQQCLFGLHNLCDYKKGSTVCIAESEKTAIIMSIIYPGYLWLATGCKSNLKEQLLKPIKNYNIIAYPDKTEFSDWSKTVNHLIDIGYNITISDLLEHKVLEDGDDLVDFIFEPNTP